MDFISIMRQGTYSYFKKLIFIC